jgi:hypothetical protein
VSAVCTKGVCVGGVCDTHSSSYLSLMLHFTCGWIAERAVITLHYGERAVAFSLSCVHVNYENELVQKGGWWWWWDVQIIMNEKCGFLPQYQHFTIFAGNRVCMLRFDARAFLCKFRSLPFNPI